MRSQTYGDKQREAQQRKKQEELWKKSHPEGEPAEPAEPTPTTPIKSNKSDKATKQKRPKK